MFLANVHIQCLDHPTTEVTPLSTQRKEFLDEAIDSWPCVSSLQEAQQINREPCHCISGGANKIL
jgi:hypothetical protein